MVNYISNLNISPLNPEDGQFTGKKYDPGTGLVYFGGRFYDPEIGRFINQDTYTNLPNDERVLIGKQNISRIFQIGFNNTQGYNRYIYCCNNPLNSIDPDGKAPIATDLGVIQEDATGGSWSGISNFMAIIHDYLYCFIGSQAPSTETTNMTNTYIDSNNNSFTISSDFCGPLQNSLTLASTTTTTNDYYWNGDYSSLTTETTITTTVYNTTYLDLNTQAIVAPPTTTTQTVRTTTQYPPSTDFLPSKYSNDNYWLPNLSD